jgi:hypothetical protein
MHLAASDYSALRFSWLVTVTVSALITEPVEMSVDLSISLVFHCRSHQTVLHFSSSFELALCDRPLDYLLMAHYFLF